MLLALTTQAQAEFRTRSGLSGQAIEISRYHSWKQDCSPSTGSVKPTAKPRNGTLSWRVISVAISRNRVRPGGDECLGKPGKAVLVIYKSFPTFKGTDTFTLDVTFDGGRRNPRSYTDTYTVTVQ